MRRKQFSGEIEVYDMGGDRLDTEIGYFDLEYRPEETGYDMVRVIRMGDHAIVAYMTLDEGTPNPLEEMDGYGDIILKENNRHEWRCALDLNTDDDPDYEGIRDDEIELEAIRRSFKQLYEQHWQGSVYAIELASDGNGDDHSWNIAVMDGEKNFTYHGSTFHMYDAGFRHHYVTMLGKTREVIDDDDILKEYWLRARAQGEVGEAWAVLLDDRSYGGSAPTDWRVWDHWSKVPVDKHWRYEGVWIPDVDLVKDIEDLPEAEQLPRCLELAKQAVELYNEWANGNCYDINLEIHKRISDSGNEFTTDEDEWECVLNSSDMKDRHDCGGGVYFGSDEVGKMMDEFITQAINVVYELQGVTGKNEEGIILGQQ